ncbi:MAG: amidohydrolase [Planctomycetaceae bacterium]|nr:amidohydrolase [Planctomycetaceae bacterium]
MRIDAHHHVWSYSAAEYPWIGTGMERLARDHLPKDLAPLAAASGIDGTVAVQARQSLEESRWLLKLADANPLIRGVVGWVDLRSTHVEDQLRELAERPKFVGVRHVVQDEPDPRFLLGESFLHGIGKLATFGLTYDLLLYPQQLPAAAELVGRFPEQPFVLDHLAKPRIKPRMKAGELDPWRQDLKALGAHGNVFCKLSGLVTEADWQGWKRSDFTPYLEVALEAFGSKRLMVGSDWPVCTLAAEYAEVIGIVRDFLAPLAAAEREAIEGGNAAQFYGLDVG